MLRTLATVAGLVLMAASVCAEPAAGPAPASFANQGLVLTDLDGHVTPLDSMLAKGPLVINFWATWCGPCRIEMPYLSKVYQELGPKGVGFAAVSLDRGISKEVLDKFAKGRGFTVPLYRDDQGVLARKFGVAAIPTTVVLKPGGEVAHASRGFRPGDEILLRKKIEEVVAAVAAGAASEEKVEQ
jgi:thiol-disulfide isomerase/thioredoxin